MSGATLCPVNVRTVFDFVHDLEHEALCLLQHESAVILDTNPLETISGP